MKILSFLSAIYSALRVVGASDTHAPFSNVDPKTLSFAVASRPSISLPGTATLEVQKYYSSLPTNSWCQNLIIGEGDKEENRVYQVPYVVDVAGTIRGIRVNPSHIYSDPNQVMVQFEAPNSMTLGAVENDIFTSQHEVFADGSTSICSLFLSLQWTSSNQASRLEAHIARGSPYISMVYDNATPRIVAQQDLRSTPLVDNATSLVCGNTSGAFSTTPVLVESYIQLSFIASDMTWLIFFSEPTMVECSNANNQFELRALTSVQNTMVRMALANNCTTGSNPQYCEVGGKSRDQTSFFSELINHANIYPTAEAEVDYAVDSTANTVTVTFDWKAAKMSEMKSSTNAITRQSTETELLTYALPHQQKQLSSATNPVLSAGCTSTLHGYACPTTGNVWTLVQPLHQASFDFVSNTPRAEMVADIEQALEVDITYEIPENYMYGAGDTYFSGKMLAKLARVLILYDSMGYDTESTTFQNALTRLRQGTEVWFNGSANAPFLYDQDWGGLASCGCYYNEDTDRCSNTYPNCPALSDSGQNFGFGFYNDHHFHLGYHIYSAAVVAKYDTKWGYDNFESVLVYIRDIANPSRDDDYFTTWRHKDWFLSLSWASGVVFANNEPYLNGRNEESSSEAVAAYEAIALFGKVCVEQVFVNDADKEKRDVALQVQEMGLVLYSTEITGAQTFWHVQASNTPGVTRIYPETYTNLVVGMLWSTLAQMQTWFGGSPYLCYGIQLIPLTPAWQSRDTLSWVEDMLPVLKQSCDSTGACAVDGWSIVVYAHMATVGDWQGAWNGVKSLPDSAFESSGGNGHSRSNTLWYIATHGDN